MVASIVRAVRGTQLNKVVVQSTYGAQPGEGIGDLGVLYEFEQAVAALGVRASVIRAAYYMSNWHSALGTARGEGVVHTFFPSECALPMVAPFDLGRVAARLLAEEVDHTGVRYVEGPTTYPPRTSLVRLRRRSVAMSGRWRRHDQSGWPRSAPSGSHPRPRTRTPA